MRGVGPDSIDNDNDRFKKKGVIRVEGNRREKSRPPRKKWKSTDTRAC